MIKKYIIVDNFEAEYKNFYIVIELNRSGTDVPSSYDVKIIKGDRHSKYHFTDKKSQFDVHKYHNAEKAFHRALGWAKNVIDQEKE